MRLWFRWLAAMAAAWGTAAPGAEALRERLEEQAVAAHPRMAAAHAAVMAAAAERAAMDGFFDPRLLGAVGAARDHRGMAGLRREAPATADAAAVQAGLEWPLRAGAIVGVGAMEQARLDARDAGEPRYRRTLGARVIVPVHRDRGFAIWQAQRAAAEADLDVARGDALQVEQDVRRDVAVRLVDWLQAAGQVEVAEAALARVRRLEAEAEELVRLEMRPAYQVLQARLEVALREEERIAAQARTANARRRLKELVRSGLPAAAGPGDLLAWHEELEGPAPRPHPDGPDEPVRVGRYRAAMSAWARTLARRREAAEGLREDVALEAGYTWRGEGDRGLGRPADPVEGRAHGGEVALVWRAPWGRRAARGQLDAAEARVTAQARHLDALAGEVAAEAAVAHADWVAAEARLARIGEAVRDARAALDAEAERFRLGDGASREVLEAQKDLTQVLRRQVDIAAELLRARARFHHAVGAGGAGSPGGEHVEAR